MELYIAPTTRTTGAPMTAIQIPCCLCGTLIHPNAANQCGACLAQQYDLKSIIQRGPGGGDIIIHQCRKCRRYEHSENKNFYTHQDPESPELLALCLRRIPALNNSSNTYHAAGSGIGGSAIATSLKLIDAMWVWTEPHSMRLKLRLTIRAEVGESPRSVAVQQRLPVEFVVKFNQCPDCNREYTNRTWQAIVQLRQKRADDSPRKGLILLETAIAKNKDLRKHVLRLQATRNGFDFYFLELMHAQSFASFLSRIAPMKIRTSQKLVSEDVKNNTANVKHTVVCDMVPLCRDDLIVCDKRAARDHGGGAGRLNGRLCIVSKMSGVVHLVDAAPARNGVVATAFADLHPEKFWRGEKHYRIVFSSKRLVRFVVLDVELCAKDGFRGNNYDFDENNEREMYAGPASGVDKYALADVEVARESDFGQTDETFHCTTHLGNLLQAGDIVLGYDLISSVLPGADEWSVENSFNSSFVMPDVVLVKKSTGTMVGDNDTQVNNSEEKSGKKQRAKSSASKKRERRQRKQDKKAKDLEAAALRMGFVDEDNDSEDGDESIWEEERKAFEKELQNDPELAQELNMAEQELAKRSVVLDEEIVTPDLENINLKSDDEGGQRDVAKSFQNENHQESSQVADQSYEDN